MKRAAIYARVSRAYQEDDDRVTIDNQLQDCEAYCEKHGYVIVGRFVDKDKYRSRGKMVHPSGTRKDRPGYVKMLKATKAGEIDVIVAWKEDRLYRGAYAAIPLSELLDNMRGLNVELVMETFDFKMLGIKAAIAKIEIDNIRERMIRGKRARIERGEAPGGPIRYGYYKGEDKKLYINEDEAEVIQLLYQWYLEGENAVEMRRRLNAMNIPPRIGEQRRENGHLVTIAEVWSKNSIHNILRFEGYATGKYTTTLDGETYEIPCDPIISMATWQRALIKREENKTYRGRNVKENYLCRNLIKCPCGWTWGARTCHASKKYKGRYGYYGCSYIANRPERKHPDCPGTIGAKKTDTFVWNFILQICDNPAIFQEAIDLKVAQLLEEKGDIEDDIRQLYDLMDEVETERQWVITMARKGSITENDMESQLLALDFQTLDYRKKLDEKEAALAVQDQAIELKKWADDYLNEISVGLSVLRRDIDELSQDEIDNLYYGLEASRYEEKYNGDSMKALEWAIFEEKRRITNMLIDHVMVIKTLEEPKKIIPVLALDVPRSFASLLYDAQSLAYIDQSKRFNQPGIVI